MIDNLSAYSFTNNDVLTIYGLTSSALTTGDLTPRILPRNRDGGYTPPPVSKIYTPKEINSEDAVVFDAYLSEASTVSINLSTTSTCVNLATGYDLFNFGYQLFIEDRGQILDKVDTFNYNNTFNIVCSASFETDWEILSGSNTYTKMLSGSAIDRLPIGSYKGGSNNDIITVKYYLPIAESSPVFWPDELLNVYKTNKIIWDICSTRLGGEDLKEGSINLRVGESLYIVDQPRTIPFSCDYIITKFGFLSTGGQDLDIFASLITPETIEYPLSSPLGYCTSSSSYNNTQFIRWSGDNTEYGLESILINVKNYKDYFNTNNEISMRMAAQWYSSREDGNMNLEIVSYSGGAVTLSGFEFICTGEKISEIILPAKNITLRSGSSGVCGCLGDPFFDYGYPFDGIARTYRSSSTLSAPASLRSTENADSWYLIPKTTGAFSEIGGVSFITCAISSITFKFLFDRDQHTGVLNAKVFVNNILKLEVAPPARGIQDAEVSENEFNTFTRTIELEGCENTIVIIGEGSGSSAPGNTMSRVDITNVTYPSPKTLVGSGSGCGSGILDGVEYSQFVKDNIGILNYNFTSNKLSFTELTGSVGGNVVGDALSGIYNIGPEPTIPTTPTYSVSAIQDSFITKSTLTWSDGFITDNTFNYPLLVPNGIIDTSGGVVHLRKFTAPGEYTLLNSTFYYNDLNGSLRPITEPYNITVIVT